MFYEYMSVVIIICWTGVMPAWYA